MITAAEYLAQHSKEAAPGELTDEIRANAERTCEAAAALETASGIECKLRSGWRPAGFNASFTHHDASGKLVRGGAPKSRHMTGEGIDIADSDGALDAWLTDERLAQLGLYREHPDATPGWCHVQIVPPKSGHRTFIP